jgi:LAO/AO transport system kinase
MNKSDRSGADQAVASLQFILSFKEHNENTWLPPIIKTIASENHGIEELYQKILAHRNYLEKTGQLQIKRQQRFKNRIKDLISNYLKKELWNSDRIKMLDEKLHLIFENKEKVSYVVRELVDNFRNGQ